MNIFKVLLLGVLAFLASCAMPLVQARSVVDDTTVIRNCGDIPSQARVHAGRALTLLGDIDCGKTPKTIEFMSGDNEIRSPTSITTTGLTLIVHPGARLTIQAATVSMARTEAMLDHPVLLVLGSINFEVTTWLEQPLDGTALDEHGVAWVGDQGLVLSENEITYTASSVMVSAEKNVADPVASSNPNDGDGDENVPTDEANPAPTVHNGGKNEGDDEGKDASPIPESISGAPAEIQAPKQLEDQQKEPHTTTDFTDDVIIINNNSSSYNSSSSHDSSSSSSSHNSNSSHSSSSSHNSNSSHDGSSSHNSSSSHNNNDDDDSSHNTNSNDTEGPTYSHDGFQFHPDFVLRVGDALHERLPNTAKTAVVYVTSIDGSVVHVTATGKSPGGIEEHTIDPVPQRRRTLLAANERRMSKVDRLRAEVMAEREEAEKAAVESRGRKTSKMVNVLGFLPFGKHGFRRRRARERATAHMGEATLSVNNKGNLEVSVDGSIVLRQSGPSWLGYRKTDSSYEVRVTEDGVMVSRGGRFDWGIQAKEPQAQVAPTSISLCDKYPDV